MLILLAIAPRQPIGEISGIPKFHVWRSRYPYRLTAFYATLNIRVFQNTDKANEKLFKRLGIVRQSTISIGK